METCARPSTKYRLRAGASTGPTQVVEELTTAGLRERVDAWFEDESAVTLVIEPMEVERG